MSLAKDNVSKLISIIDESINALEENRNLILERDKEVVDLYHEIEFKNFNACEGYILAKELQTVLQERREYKREVATLEILVEFLNKNPQFKNGLIACNNRIRQSENSNNNLKYTPRIRTDLSIAT